MLTLGTCVGCWPPGEHLLQENWIEGVVTKIDTKRQQVEISTGGPFILRLTDMQFMRISPHGEMRQVSDYFKDGNLVDGKLDTRDENPVARAVASLETSLRDNHPLSNLLTERPIFQRHTHCQQSSDEDHDDEEVEILPTPSKISKKLTLQQLVQTAFPFQQGCTVQAMKKTNSFTVVRQQKGKPRVVIGRIRSDTFSATGTETGMCDLAWLLKERQKSDDRGIVLRRYRAMKKRQL